MIKIIRGSDKDHPGRFSWHVDGTDLGGISRQPLLDACRALKSTGADTSAECGLFRGANPVPDLITTIGAGAALTVEERKDGNAPRFRAYEPFVREKINGHKTPDLD